MDQKTQEDLANYITRQRYSLDTVDPQKTRRWLQRKHKIKLTVEEAEDWIRHYLEMYATIANLLPRFIKPSTTGFAETQFIEREKLAQETNKLFGENESERVINIVTGWVIYYEYLR